MKILVQFFKLVFFASMVAGCASTNTVDSPLTSLLIRDVTVVDGTGSPPFLGSVRIKGDKITDVGDLAPATNDIVISGQSLTLVPGFIDTHSHHDAGLLDKPEALGAISQGITTIVAGQDGSSMFPLSKFFTALAATPTAVNVASYSGHNTIRAEVMGPRFQRPATLDEIQQMGILVEKDLQAGALGLGTGLEYDPGIYSETDEILSLAKIAAKYEGRYVSHMRSEDRYFWEAVDELLEIGRVANIPVQISHAKLAMKSLWGQSDELLNKLDQARNQGIDVTLDVYPYEYWQSTLLVLFPDRDFDSIETARLILSDIVPADGISLVHYQPEPTLVGKTLETIASEREIDPAQTLLDLISTAYEDPAAENDTVESILGKSMRDQDIIRLLKWPHANVCSDGGSEGGHPRGFGAFPRVLKHYFKDQRVLSLPEAIHKMTQAAAQHMGMKDRGWIGPGAKADLVLVDLNTIQDNADIDNPMAHATGINTVWVNGKVVYKDGKHTGRFPGQVVKR